MATRIELSAGWSVAAREPAGDLGPEELLSWTSGNPSATWYESCMPAQAHHVLVDHGVIRDPAEIGACEECLWVGETDWIYRLEFEAPAGFGSDGTAVELLCDGLDTLVVLYLNGRQLAFHDDCFLPLRVDLTGELDDTNTLLLHFHAPRPWMERSPEVQAFVASGGMAKKMIRKGVEDFGFFNGPKPWFTPIGVYAPMSLRVVDRARIVDLVLDADVSADLDHATVRVACRTSVVDGASVEGAVVRCRLSDPRGRVIESLAEPIGDGEATLGFEIASPELWYPHTYGRQPLYGLVCRLELGGEVVDEASRRVGLRRVERHGDFDYSVNGLRVKLWGANLTPLPRPGHRHDHDALRRTLDLATQMHMPALRVWGPSMPWPESLLDEADERGILLWMEFAHTGPGYPGDEHFLDLCRAEAEHWVRSWRHHASILLWSGGNEAYLGMEWAEPEADAENPDRYLFDTLYREVCERLDPQRWYIPNSPFAGPYGNYTRAGDAHIRNYHFFQPSDEYPLLPSENIRITIALEKTLRRHLGDDLAWPDGGFRGTRTRFSDPAIPPAWVEAMSPNMEWINVRVGCQGELYDADGTARSLLMRIGKGSATFARRTLERLRRGRPASDPDGPRRTMGHFWWKLNDTFPMIYASLIDDQLEPNMTFYAMRRALSPVLVSIDAGDSLWVWVVNDGRTDVTGTLRVRVLGSDGQATLHEAQAPVRVRQGASAPVFNADRFGMFARSCPVIAELVGEDGTLIAESIDYVAPEREIPFPGDARIELRDDGDAIVVSADAPVRWVELAGRSNDGDEFGWDFEDNFFDLVPGGTRRVRLLGRHRSGVVTARSAYSSHETRLTIGHRQE